MIEYTKPIALKPLHETKENKFKTKLRQIIEKLKPKKNIRVDEFKEAYKQRYDEVYKLERIEFLKRKAEQDARLNAKKDNSIGSIMSNIITGGRGKQ